MNAIPQETEAQAQARVCLWLDLRGILYCHVPNGGKRGLITGRQLKRQGLKKGVQDILIFDPPPAFPDRVGTAVEMKRRDGGKGESGDQVQWRIALVKRRWVSLVAYGADDAIRQLMRLGY